MKLLLIGKVRECKTGLVEAVIGHIEAGFSKHIIQLKHSDANQAALRWELEGLEGGMLGYEERGFALS